MSEYLKITHNYKDMSMIINKIDAPTIHFNFILKNSFYTNNIFIQMVIKLQ